MNIDYVRRQLEKLASSRDCELVFEVNRGASERELSDASQFCQAQMSRSLVDFLRQHNGVSIKFFREADVRSYQTALPRHSLVIYSTADIVHWTTDLREYLRGIEFQSEAVRTMAWRCIDFATWGDVSWRLAYVLDAARPNNEYAIVEADLDYGDWLNTLISPESRPPIAASFEEFFNRSIDYMLETARGFRYWDPQDCDRVLV